MKHFVVLFLELLLVHVIDVLLRTGLQLELLRISSLEHVRSFNQFLLVTELLLLLGMALLLTLLVLLLLLESLVLVVRIIYAHLSPVLFSLADLFVITSGAVHINLPSAAVASRLCIWFLARRCGFVSQDE